MVRKLLLVFFFIFEFKCIFFGKWNCVLIEMLVYFFLFFNILFFEILILYKNVMVIGYKINKELLRIKKFIFCLFI